MAAQSRNVGLPTAIALVGAFAATLLVLLASAANGSRPWILLMRAAGAFLLTFEVLRIVAAGTMLLMRRFPESVGRRVISKRPISSSIPNTELKSKGVS